MLVLVFSSDLLTRIKYIITPDFLKFLDATQNKEMLCFYCCCWFDFFFFKPKQSLTSTDSSRHIYVLIYLLPSICDPCILQQLKLRVVCVFECALKLKVTTNEDFVFAIIDTQVWFERWLNCVQADKVCLVSIYTRDFIYVTIWSLSCRLLCVWSSGRIKEMSKKSKSLIW